MYRNSLRKNKFAESEADYDDDEEVRQARPEALLVWVMRHHSRRRRRVHCSVARTGAAVKLWGVECSGDDLGCRGKMCVSLTPCRDSRACTFLECMEDYSTSGDLSSSHPRKRVAVRIREVAYSFGNRRPNWRNGMKHPTISLSHAMAGPRHRTMNRRSRSHVLGSLRPNNK